MKYIELFKNGFDETITEKIKPENYPYVGYSLIDGFAFTVIPEPATGPADNEIWYTTSSGEVYNNWGSYDGKTNAKFISDKYENGKGILTFDAPLTFFDVVFMNDFVYMDSIMLPDSIKELGPDVFRLSYGI
jgi:hypothetical protein